MRVPIRKGGKYTHLKPDPYLTPAKFDQLKNELEKLKKSQPSVASEVRRLAELGDFSENAAYQMAKGKLRGLNQKILELEDHLKKAVIIEPTKNSDVVGLGSEVTVELSGQRKTYLILGSSETNPQQGIISHHSPLGAGLMGRRVGEQFTLKLAGKSVEGKIIKVE